MAHSEHDIKDTDIMGEKAGISHEEVAYLGQLTPEEKVIEKKLRRRIDLLIMPLVILVYLMNYIDRYVPMSWLSSDTNLCCWCIQK
jgi:hypothetical protein